MQILSINDSQINKQKQKKNNVTFSAKIMPDEVFKKGHFDKFLFPVKEITNQNHELFGSTVLYIKKMEWEKNFSEQLFASYDNVKKAAKKVYQLIAEKFKNLYIDENDINKVFSNAKTDEDLINNFDKLNKEADIITSDKFKKALKKIKDFEKTEKQIINEKIKLSTIIEEQEEKIKIAELKLEEQEKIIKKEFNIK